MAGEFTASEGSKKALGNLAEDAGITSSGVELEAPGV
jgi:hypothetical protein